MLLPKYILSLIDPWSSLILDADSALRWLVRKLADTYARWPMPPAKRRNSRHGQGHKLHAGHHHRFAILPNAVARVWGLLLNGCRLRPGMLQSNVDTSTPHAGLLVPSWKSSWIWQGHGNFLSHCDRGAASISLHTPRGHILLLLIQPHTPIAHCFSLSCLLRIIVDFFRASCLRIPHLSAT